MVRLDSWEREMFFGRRHTVPARNRIRKAEVRVSNHALVKKQNHAGPSEMSEIGPTGRKICQLM
jgi:hypothetical protein